MDLFKQYKYAALLLLPATMVAGFVLVPPPWMKKWPSMLFAQRVAREAFKGHLEGVYNGSPNHVTFSYGIQPGDVIMCHNANCAYGYWTHCAIYIGNNQAVDSEDFTNGTRIVDVKKYNQYDKVAIFRGIISAHVRRNIIKSAIQEAGKPYDPFSSLSDSHSEYCSKLIWHVFDENGIHICRKKVWIIPDDIVNGAKLHMISTWLS